MGTAYNAFGQFTELWRLIGPVRGRPLGRNVQGLQLVEDRLHGTVRSAEEGTAPHSCEGPSESLEHRLSLHVIAELFEREIPIPIALDGQTLAVTFQDRKSTRLNSSHLVISYAVFCL